MSRRGPDAGGVVAGVLFVVIGLVFVLHELDVWTIRLSYVLPLLLIALGLALLLGWIVAAARQR